MSREIIQTDNAPAAVGTYSQAVKVGQTVYVSGQIGLNPATMELADGFDAQVVHLLFSKMGNELLLVQDNWDLVLNELRFGHLDLITGMEITPLRQRYFDFTMPY